MPGRASSAATASSTRRCIGLGLIDEPLDALLYSVNGVVITLTYFLLPFAVLPIYGNLRAIDDAPSRRRATSAPGRWAVLRDIVLPQCERGIVIAFTFAFLISVGDYVTPRFVGGGAAMMGISSRCNSPSASTGRWAAPWPSPSWRCRWPGRAVARALLAGACGHERARLSSDLGWRVFALLVAGFHGRAAGPGRAVQLQRIGPDQPAADRLHAWTGTASCSPTAPSGRRCGTASSSRSASPCCRSSSARWRRSRSRACRRAAPSR